MFGDGTVDLITQSPVLVSACEWAIRLTKDPAVGADQAFNFCLTCIFQHTLGWDFDERKSASSGDILAKLEAFHSNSEFTDRNTAQSFSSMFKPFERTPKYA